MSDPGEAAATAPDGWEEVGGDSRAPAPGAAGPHLSVEGFEGPLDWLLEMVRARQIDLARLPLLALVTGFVTALERALAGRDHAASLGRWGDWLVMAANLALLRSRLLLPANTADARDAAEEADLLRRRLVSRAEIRAAVEWLESRRQLHRDIFPRGGGEDHGPAERQGDITDLLRACLVAIRLPDDGEDYRPRPPPVWRVSDAITLIRARLGQAAEGGSPLAAFLPAITAPAAQTEAWSRVALATTFLAGLELAREGQVALEQPQAWEAVHLHRPKPGPRRTKVE